MYNFFIICINYLNPVFLFYNLHKYFKKNFNKIFENFNGIALILKILTINSKNTNVRLVYM